MRRLTVLTFATAFLSGPVAATSAAPPSVRAGMACDSSSARHHRQVRRSHRIATAPKILKVTPNAIQVGVPNALDGQNPDHIDLMVTGSGFQHGAVVRWDDKLLSTHFIDPTRLEARVPFDYLSVNTLHTVKPNSAGGSGPRGMDSDGATGTAWLRVRNRRSRTSNRAAFTVSYVVVGG